MVLQQSSHKTKKKKHLNYTSKLEGNKIHLTVQVIYNNKTKNLEKIYWENFKNDDETKIIKKKTHKTPVP